MLLFLITKQRTLGQEVLSLLAFALEFSGFKDVQPFDRPLFSSLLSKPMRVELLDKYVLRFRRNFPTFCEVIVSSYTHSDNV